jgi:hypothetical protein
MAHMHLDREQLIEAEEEFNLDYRRFIVAVSREMNGSVTLPEDWNDIRRLRWAARHAELRPVDISKFMDDLLSLVDMQRAFISYHPCRQGHKHDE